MNDMNKQDNEGKTLSITGLVLGILSLLSTVFVINSKGFLEQGKHPGAGMGIAIYLMVIAVPMVVIFSISLAINIKSLLKLKNIKSTNRRLWGMSLAGLITSLPFIYAIIILLASL